MIENVQGQRKTSNDDQVAENSRFTLQIYKQQSDLRTGLCAFRNHQKVDALADQVYRFAKVRPAISSKHAKNHLFDFFC